MVDAVGPSGLSATLLVTVFCELLAESTRWTNGSWCARRGLKMGNTRFQSRGGGMFRLQYELELEILVWNANQSPFRIWWFIFKTWILYATVKLLLGSNMCEPWKWDNKSFMLPFWNAPLIYVAGEQDLHSVSSQCAETGLCCQCVIQIFRAWSGLSELWQVVVSKAVVKNYQ